MWSSKWAMAMVGVITLLVVTTAASASPPPTVSRDVLDDRFVNNDRRETIQANVRGPLLTVKNTTGRAVAKGVYGRTTTGSAIYGNSPKGYGVYGYTRNGYAVYGQDRGSAQGKGYGGYFTSNTGVGVYGYSSATEYYTNVYTPGVYGRSKNGVGVMGWGASGTGDGIGVFGYGRGGSGGIFITGDGDNVIEGYEELVSPLDEIARRFRVTCAGDVYASRAYHDWGADFADMMPAVDGLEPADVLVIAPDGKLTRSTEPYQASVAGVYSTEPGFVGGDSGEEELTGKVPLALAGLVPVKASAENGPIVPGDLLVTSSTPGHAMRG